jgi:hypothetical protein
MVALLQRSVAVIALCGVIAVEGFNLPGVHSQAFSDFDP